MHKEFKQLIDRKITNKETIWIYGGGRAGGKTLLALQLNIATHLRLCGFSWEQIEEIVGDNFE